MGWQLILELFGFSIVAAILAGLVCPLVGALLLVRRAGFQGVALPQFAAAGVACGFALLPWWIEHIGLHGMDVVTALESPHALMNYHLGFAAVFTLGALAVFALTARRQETETARVATGFALASAAVILFSHASPIGHEYVDVLLHGEILVIGRHELETLAVVFVLALVLFVRWGEDLVLVSADRDFASVLRLPVRRLEALLLLITGLVISVGTLIVGPIVMFGLLVVPPLAARSMARSMRGYLYLSAALGIASATAGVTLSFELDWPLGPSVVAAAALTLVPARVVDRFRG